VKASCLTKLKADQPVVLISVRVEWRKLQKHTGRTVGIRE